MTDETTDEPSQYSDPEPNDAGVEDAPPAEASSDAAPDPQSFEAEPKAQPVRRMVWAPRTRIAVASLALVAMMFLFVFPTRSYLAQKRQVGQAAHAVDVLEAQNAVLARQATRLKTRSEIERLAREQFNMVRPGEQAYDVVEAPGSNSDTTTTTTP